MISLRKTRLKPWDPKCLLPQKVSQPFKTHLRIFHLAEETKLTDVTIKVHDGHLPPPILDGAQGREGCRVVAAEGEDPRRYGGVPVGGRAARYYSVRLVQLLERVRVVQPDQRRVAAVRDGGPGAEWVLAWKIKDSAVEQVETETL